MIRGISRIPLVDIICDDEEPDKEAQYLTFNKQMVACAPHTWQYYQADSHRVHNLLTGFLHGELTKMWICSLSCYQDGSHDMLALHHQYAGEGNSTRQIADSKHIQTSLFYKTNHALPFNTFLDPLQKMFFAIYEDAEEPLMEQAKVKELLDKVQHASFSTVVAQWHF
jgi:hypothetical protein